MGRTEPSVGQPPASFRRDARAKKARATLNQLIPSLLTTHPRARRGIDSAELIVDPPPAQAAAGPAAGEASGPRIRLQVADTLSAAARLVHGAPAGPPRRVAILNMASPLSPGGGFLSGAGSQEETLCMRTTLLPSLRDGYYRLPELGAVYTPDVLVFRGRGGRGSGDDDDRLLPKGDRWFVDCISAAMLRSPDTERGAGGGWGRYANDKDRELALRKMRVVLRVCQLKGVTHVVLGAWGAGAHGNPIAEIGPAWRKVLLPRDARGGGKKKNGKKGGGRETWEGVEEVVFAIKDAGMADSFETAFGEGLVREEPEDGDEEEEEEGEGEGVGEGEPAAGELRRRELLEKIRALERRIETTAHPQVRDGLRPILAGLIRQLPEDDGEVDCEDDGEVDCEDDGGVGSKVPGTSMPSQ